MVQLGLLLDDMESPAPASERVPTPAPARKPRGFAALRLSDPERVREIARKGGRAAHAAGTAHQFTTEEARAAGKKGGNAPHARRGRGKRPCP